MNLINLEDFQQRDFKHDYRLRALLKLIPQIGGKILDVGSGNGEIAVFLSKKADIVYATDNSEILLKKLQIKTRGISNIKVEKIDAEDFNFQKKDFNLITATDIIEHLKGDTAFLKNCYSHLKDGGYLFISVPAVKSLYGIRDKKLGHHKRYDKSEIIYNIKQAGFKIKRCQYWNFLGFPPYFISEKILKKELIGPARMEINSLFSRFLNRLLYFWLVVEGKIEFLPIGLSLIILAQKR